MELIPSYSLDLHQGEAATLLHVVRFYINKAHGASAPTLEFVTTLEAVLAGVVES